MKISPSETILTGRWLARGGELVSDDNCKRIDDLIRNHLKEVGRDQTGWDVLYRDPDDGRLWELVYPHSDTHGGGPPQLRCLSEEAAKEKYGFLGVP